MEAHQILIRPIITERATVLTERFNQFVFQVERKANKYQIRSAVESVYGVKVKKVATMIVPERPSVAVQLLVNGLIGKSDYHSSAG